MGQRLAVVEPPIIPDEPVWPDRLLILVAGIGGGFGLGLILAAAVELLNRPIRDPKALASIAGVPSLGVIPTIDSVRPGLSRPKFRFWRKSAIRHEG
jgi:capsular polysaccharide biosynthesis protein